MQRKGLALPLGDARPVVCKVGWGAWIRTKIHSFKGYCAAIAPRPNNGPYCITGSQGKQLSVTYFFGASSLPGVRPRREACSKVNLSGSV